LDILGLPEHVFTILTEADYRIAGDLILAMKTEPDKVLGLAGIGPKAMQAIEKAVAETKFEAPVPVEEPAPVAEVAPVVEPAAVMEVAEPESLPTETQTQAEPAPVIEAEPVVEIPVIAAEEEEEESEKSFEDSSSCAPKLSNLLPLMTTMIRKTKKARKRNLSNLNLTNPAALWLVRRSINVPATGTKSGNLTFIFCPFS
jgi:hypothetical protein